MKKKSKLNENHAYLTKNGVRISFDDLEIGTLAYALRFVASDDLGDKAEGLSMLRIPKEDIDRILAVERNQLITSLAKTLRLSRTE